MSVCAWSRVYPSRPGPIRRISYVAARLMLLQGFKTLAMHRKFTEIDRNRVVGTVPSYISVLTYTYLTSTYLLERARTFLLVPIRCYIIVVPIFKNLQIGTYRPTGHHRRLYLEGFEALLQVCT